MYGKIYKLKTLDGKMCYIGSTTLKTLEMRLAKHKNHWKRWVMGKDNLYVSSFEVLAEDGDAVIELMEVVQFSKFEELRRREQQLIRECPNCVNRNMTC